MTETSSPSADSTAALFGLFGLELQEFPPHRPRLVLGAKSVDPDGKEDWMGARNYKNTSMNVTNQAIIDAILTKEERERYLEILSKESEESGSSETKKRNLKIRLLIQRHGNAKNQGDHNKVNGKYPINPSLDETGFEQSRTTDTQIKALPESEQPRLIVSSTLRRAIQTAVTSFGSCIAKGARAVATEFVREVFWDPRDERDATSLEPFEYLGDRKWSSKDMFKENGWTDYGENEEDGYDRGRLTYEFLVKAAQIFQTLDMADGSDGTKGLTIVVVTHGQFASHCFWNRFCPDKNRGGWLNGRVKILDLEAEVDGTIDPDKKLWDGDTDGWSAEVSFSTFGNYP